MNVHLSMNENKNTAISGVQNHVMLYVKVIYLHIYFQ